MALVVVAIFDEVYEGEIAASLLRSADMPCWLLGDQLAKLYPFKQRAWGGCRLAVAEEDASDARAILDLARSGALEPEEPTDLPPPATGLRWTAAALVMAFTTMIESGWAVNGLRRRRRPVQVIGTALLALIAIYFLSMIVLDAIDFVSWLVAR